MKKILFSLVAFFALATSASAQCRKVYQNGQLKAIYYVSKDDRVEFSDDFPFPDGKDNMENGHEYVDLGLSVKWATCNVGVEKPEDYGDYYAWGETQTKSFYDWSTYLDSPNRDGKSFTKYNNNGGKTQLLPEDDVAHVKWKGTWRMPTKAEQDELQEQCTWTWTSQGGKNGYKVTSKKNGNSIFLPAAGWRGDGELSNAGSDGNYWSSSLNPNYDFNAFGLYFDSGGWNWGYGLRLYGHSVRAVCP